MGRLTALVLGGGNSVFIDAARALDMFSPDLVVVCNDIGTEWPGHVDAWVTLHAEKFQRWQNERMRAGLNMDYIAITHMHANRKNMGRVDLYCNHKFPQAGQSGSSGLFATKIAMEMGATHIVLAGIPMQRQGAHFFTEKPWTEVDSFTRAWILCHSVLIGRVRSMSGWTRERLGYPDREWLEREA